MTSVSIVWNARCSSDFTLARIADWHSIFLLWRPSSGKGAESSPWRNSPITAGFHVNILDAFSTKKSVCLQNFSAGSPVFAPPWRAQAEK